MPDLQRQPIHRGKAAEAFRDIFKSQGALHVSEVPGAWKVQRKDQAAARIVRDYRLAGSLLLPAVRLLLLPLAVLLASCASRVTRGEAVATAYRYTQVQWMPEARHVRHGPDSQGIVVHTPDRSLARRGWWQPGVSAKSLPYQWGGFDTPESFLAKIATGKKAGDIADEAKRKLGDAGASTESCGIDCSGFVSRCWNLKRAYSTREFHKICDPLASWEDLRPGDILLNDKHVVLFVKWTVPGKELAAYEAGPFPVWKVSACGLYQDKLLKEGYAPWRYRGMVENP